MTVIPILAFSTFAMLLQTRLSERALADVAVIRVPRSVKEMYKGARDDQAGRLVFAFSSTYFWASFGSGQAYKQQIFVSVMAPDASEREYELYPDRYRLSYDGRKTVRRLAVGSGSLTITEGVYQQNTLQEPSYTFFYVDRARRLQIAWHAVKSEVDLATGIDVVAKMASSFRIVRDPTTQFAEMRDRPRREAEDRTRRRTLAREMLTREGFGPLEPGAPVLRGDVYVEWMADPEPRFQLVLPLGRVRVDPEASRASRPRPLRLDVAGGTATKWAGTVEWREHVDGQWELSNNENAYLPFTGITATMAASDVDAEFVYFYYAATVRVEEEADDTRLTNLRWFFDGLPEVRRLWREGKLVRGGSPASD